MIGGTVGGGVVPVAVVGSSSGGKACCVCFSVIIVSVTVVIVAVIMSVLLGQCSRSAKVRSLTAHCLPPRRSAPTPFVTTGVHF
jgi:Na+/citrate or Na+/malate symporter